MSKFIVKSIDELHKEQRNHVIQKSSDDKIPTFTPEESKTLLQVMVEDIATYKVGYYYPTKMQEEVASVTSYVSGEPSKQSDDITAPTEDNLADIANGIYRNIIKQWKYDPITLQICRKAKFDLAFVRAIVDAIDADYTNENMVGKSLGRSLRKVANSIGAETMSDLVKAHPSYSDIEKSGTPYPVRIYAFLKSIEKGVK